MDLTIPTLDPPSGVNERADGQSAFESLDNVLALLDEKRSRQLVQGVIPAVTYTGDFEVVGRDDRLDPPTQLCSPCKELIQRPPPIYQFTDMKDTPPAQFWVPHHDTLFQLIDCCFSRSGSCRLCQLLWHGVCRENRRLRSLRHGNKNVAWPDDTLKIALKANEIQFRQIFLGLNIFLEQNIHLTITCSRNPFSDPVNLYPVIAGSTDSTLTFDQIREWLNHCLMKHNMCQVPWPTDCERPTRLIFIDHQAGIIQLTTHVPPETWYAAVSYRWSHGGDSYMLREETDHQMREGVPMSVLPKTLLDTCSIAHQLGLRYIWVDRLCIYQDSREDWIREASRMAFVYKHALLTISASCASHDNQGCFRKRNAPGIQPLWLISNPLLPSVPETSGHGDNGSYICSTRAPYDRKEGGMLGYLEDRGWVYQERILSQRIIHFAEEEVYWECRELGVSEACPEQFKPYYPPERPSVAKPPGLKGWNPSSHWRGIVNAYSACKLTFEKDRLPAISGLARELEKDVDDEYLAGLWRKTVHHGLCWGVYDSIWKDAPRNTWRHTSMNTPRIPEEYLAPSWSWASLHGRIRYLPAGSVVAHPPVATFKNARLKLATADPYGAVDDGWIHLFGHLIPVMLVPEKTFSEQLQSWEQSMSIRGPEGNDLAFLDLLHVSLDIKPSAADETRSVPMFCVLVSGEEQVDKIESSQRFFCLLLVPLKYRRSGEAFPSPNTPYEDEYQRAGLAYFAANNWSAFEAWLSENQERDIVIR